MAILFRGGTTGALGRSSLSSASALDMMSFVFVSMLVMIPDDTESPLGLSIVTDLADWVLALESADLSMETGFCSSVVLPWILDVLPWILDVLPWILDVLPWLLAVLLGIAGVGGGGLGVR